MSALLYSFSAKDVQVTREHMKEQHNNATLLTTTVKLSNATTEAEIG